MSQDSIPIGSMPNSPGPIGSTSTGSTPTKTRILLIDDHSLFREAIGRLLGAEPDFEVVGECATVEEGLNHLRTNNAAVVLLDINLGLQQGQAFLNLSWAPPFHATLLLVPTAANKREPT